MKNNRPVYILGTGLSHDGSACLLKDGEISVAIEKERITRIKHDGGNDNDAIEYCLKAENIGINDVDLIVQCGGGNLYFENNHLTPERTDRNRLVNEQVNKIPIVNLSHHLAHAYNAIGTSPFEEMAILVIDGSGQEMNHCLDLKGTILPETLPAEYSYLCFEKDSFYYYRDGRLSSLYKDFSPLTELWLGLTMFPKHMAHSIGDMYEQASSYCLGAGTSDNGAQQAGKLMGLAPFGRPDVYNQKIFSLKDGRVFINYDWQHEFDRPCRDYAHFKSNFRYYADIAYWVQKEAEEAIFYIVNHRSGLCNTKNLAYTGGVALNAVANKKITERTPFENLYLTPAAGDNGLAIGCAYYGWLEILKNERNIHSGNSCFGRKYSKSEILDVVREHKPHTNIQVKRTINTFFSMLPDCFEKDKINGLSCKTQLIIKDVNMYALEFKDGECKQVTDVIEGADGVLITDGGSLIKWMLGESTVESLMRERKVLIEGDFTQIALSMNMEISKKKMTESLNWLTECERGLRFTYEADVITSAAKLLAEGKVIGWFQDGSEFGPRALGHRSILADPRRKDVRQFINSNIKLREDFRPFAPSVLREDVSRYFKYDGESPYMILVVEVRPEWKDKLPAVVHDDNSCRIQTVTTEWNDKYFELLKVFKELTGISVLLNTSFNRRGMPIVETPLEALNFFLESDLDNLVIDNYIIYKNFDSPIPAISAAAPCLSSSPHLTPEN